MHTQCPIGLLIVELPAGKNGGIVSDLLICFDEGMTIIPGEGGSLVGSMQRLIYMLYWLNVYCRSLGRLF